MLAGGTVMNNLNPSYIFATTATAGALLAAGIYLYKKQQENKIPTKWKRVAEVTNLYLYPLKSGKEIALEEAECTPFGFRLVGDESVKLRDRCFVVFTERKSFITARRYPKMVLISIIEHLPLKNHVAIDAPGMRTLYVKVPDFEESLAEKITMHFNEELTALDCGDEAANWFSRFLLEKDTGLRLGFYPEHIRRNISVTHKDFLQNYKNLSNDSTGMFADVTSYTIINEASIDDLNDHLTSSNSPTVSHKNFRPNIVIRGEEVSAFTEDNWDWVKVGDVILRKSIPSTRCILTTINPQTGERSTNREPLKTLETYRQLGEHLNQYNINNFNSKHVVMGIHSELKKGGYVHVGDAIFVPEV